MIRQRYLVTHDILLDLILNWRPIGYEQSSWWNEQL